MTYCRTTVLEPRLLKLSRLVVFLREQIVQCVLGIKETLEIARSFLQRKIGEAGNYKEVKTGYLFVFPGNRLPEMSLQCVKYFILVSFNSKKNPAVLHIPPELCMRCIVENTHNTFLLTC